MENKKKNAMKKKETPLLEASSGNGPSSYSPIKVPSSGLIRAAIPDYKPSNYEYKQDKFLFDAF